MRERIEKRLAELESELNVGARRLHDLEREEVALRETLSRIGGAVIVLREMLRDGDAAGSADNGAMSPEGLAAPTAR